MEAFGLGGPHDPGSFIHYVIEDFSGSNGGDPGNPWWCQYVTCEGAPGSPGTESGSGSGGSGNGSGNGGSGGGSGGSGGDGGGGGGNGSGQGGGSGPYVRPSMIFEEF